MPARDNRRRRQSGLAFVDSLQSVSRVVGLVGDALSPGNSKYYGTDSAGDKGFYDLPAGGGGGMIYPGAGIAVSTGTAWDGSITDNSTLWNMAYDWGDHSQANYAHKTETEPVLFSGPVMFIAGLTVVASVLGVGLGPQNLVFSVEPTRGTIIFDGGLYGLGRYDAGGDPENLTVHDCGRLILISAENTSVHIYLPSADDNRLQYKFAIKTVPSPGWGYHIHVQPETEDHFIGTLFFEETDAWIETQGNWENPPPGSGDSFSLHCDGDGNWFSYQVHGRWACSS